MATIHAPSINFFDAVDSCSLTDGELRDAARSWIEFYVAGFNSLNAEQQAQGVVEFVKALKEMPMAIDIEENKEKTYELPTEFFKLMLGKRLKFSCTYFPNSTCTLDESEEAMLELYFKRAQLNDGQSVLDLGGGWGALAFFIAEKCPSSQVVSLSYSASHKEYIEKECRERGISNVKAVNANIVTAELDETYDRILSIEMFDHIKNYHELLKKLSGWLKPNGLLFVEFFTHKLMPSHIIRDIGPFSWIETKFFPGVTLASDSLLLYFQDHVSIRDHWVVSGNHFSLWCDACLKNLDENQHLLHPIFATACGEQNAKKNYVYWRVFNIVFSELFKLNNGEEFIVSQYLFAKK